VQWTIDPPPSQLWVEEGQSDANDDPVQRAFCNDHSKTMATRCLLILGSGDHVVSSTSAAAKLLLNFTQKHAVPLCQTASASWFWQAFSKAIGWCPFGRPAGPTPIIPLERDILQIDWSDWTVASFAEPLVMPCSAPFCAQRVVCQADVCLLVQCLRTLQLGSNAEKLPAMRDRQSTSVSGACNVIMTPPFSGWQKHGWAPEVHGGKPTASNGAFPASETTATPATSWSVHFSMFRKMAAAGTHCDMTVSLHWKMDDQLSIDVKNEFAGQWGRQSLPTLVWTTPLQLCEKLTDQLAFEGS
jgi:hypothetical protein